MEITSKSLKKTKKIAEELVRKIIKIKSTKALVFGLKGDLGGGKTSFTQGIARELGIKEKVLSPTFIIMNKIKIPYSKKTFYHFDCYRIEDYREILNLGFKNIISNPLNIVVIEWPEKIEKIMPKDYIKIEFRFIDKKTRKIIY